MSSLWTIDTSNGKLTINSLNMHTAAWLVLDVRQLYIPTAFRGDNVVIPNAAGTRAYPVRIDEVTHSLPMWITGTRTSTGGVNSNRFAGHRVNVDTLRSSLLSPTTAATLNATLTSVPGTTKTYSAGVQILGLDLEAFKPDEQRLITKALLHMRIPHGRFTT